MKKSCIKISLPRCYKYIPIVIALNCIQRLITESITNHYKNPIINLLFLSIGQSFSLILFIYQRIKKMDSINYLENGMKLHKFTIGHYLWIFGILSLCAITDILGNIRYEYLIDSETMKKIIQIRAPILLEPLFFSIFIFFIEHYFLKINTLKHHILGIGMNAILLSINIIYTFHNRMKEISFYTILSFTPIFFIILEKQILQIFYYIIPKKINYEFFMNMNLISFLKSVIQFALCLLLYFFFLDEFKYQISDSNSKINLLEIEEFKYVFICLYFVISCLQIIYVLKITEVSRPSYNLIPIFFSNYIYRIIDMYFNEFDIMFLLSFTPSILGILIFCETIIFSCHNLDKFTIYEISQRANNEALNDIGSFSESSLDSL